MSLLHTVLFVISSSLNSTIPTSLPRTSLSVLSSVCLFYSSLVFPPLTLFSPRAPLPPLHALIVLCFLRDRLGCFRYSSSSSDVFVSDSVIVTPRIQLSILASASSSQHPHLSILISASSSQHPHLSILISASSSQHPHLSILISASSSQHPHLSILISASSSQHPHLSILISASSSHSLLFLLPVHSLLPMCLPDTASLV